MNFTTDRRIAIDGIKNSTDLRALVVYYSRGNNTRLVAEDIALLLGADIERVVDKTDRSGFSGFMRAGRDAMKMRLTVIEPFEKNPAGYDLVVLGTPLWGFGSMTPAIRTYLTQNRGSITEHALFCTRWFKNPDKFFKSFEEITGRKPVATLAYTTKELSDTNYTEYDRKMKIFVERLKEQ